MPTTISPFSGEPLPFGGLSNEKELVDACPQDFRKDSRWSDYAASFPVRGMNQARWKWKSADRAECRRQLACLHGLLETFELPHADKVAVAGWMLSEMLAEVPAS